MSFLSWFGKKEQAHYAATAPGSDLLQSDATQPLSSALNAPAPLPPLARKSERHERRDLLYGVVRECMTAAGLLSSTYKFKVLSLDSSGRKYLIMMDIPRDYFAKPEQFSDMEGSIARGAKDRYDLLVTAVYWRMNESATAASVYPSSAAHKAAHPAPVAAPVPEAPPVHRTPEPVAATPALQELQDEVLAFKQALASGATPAVSVPMLDDDPDTQIAPGNDFSDTVPYDNTPALGPTQFGKLE